MSEQQLWWCVGCARYHNARDVRCYAVERETRAICVITGRPVVAVPRREQHGADTAQAQPRSFRVLRSRR